MVLRIEISYGVKTNCPTKNNTQDIIKNNLLLRYYSGVSQESILGNFWCIVHQNIIRYIPLVIWT